MKEITTIIDFQRLVLLDPETGEDLHVSGPLTVYDDGSFSFDVENSRTGRKWRHTVTTKEIKHDNLV